MGSAYRLQIVALGLSGFARKAEEVCLWRISRRCLSDARKKRDDAKALLALGIDPSQQRKLDKITKALANEATFDAVAEEYLANTSATTNNGVRRSKSFAYRKRRSKARLSNCKVFLLAMGFDQICLN